MRIEQLTFTRFLAAFFILIFHFGQNYFSKDSWFSTIFETANVAVSYFFVLSGFVMVLAYQQSNKINVIRYLKKRFFRIYPLYLLALFLTIIILIESEDLNLIDTILNLFLLQSWFEGKALTLNFPGWSLSVEFFFYAFFPFVFNKFYNTSTFKRLALGIILFWVGSQLFFHWMIMREFSDSIYYYPLLHLNSFLLGNLTALIFLKFKEGNNSRNFDFYIIGLIISIVLLLKYLTGVNFHNGLLGPFFATLIILISLNTGKIGNWFKNKSFQFLGNISYGIYILQIPVFSLGIFTDFRLEKYLGIQKEWNVSFFFYLLLLIAVSSLSYLFIEKPIVEGVKKFSRKTEFTGSVVQ